MAPFTNRYYPTICVRRAEMRAMRHLPESEKLKMLPVVLLAPWLNSILFDNTIAIVEDCVGDIPIIADLDRYFVGSSSLPSREFFKNLLDPEDGHIEWVKFITEHQKYIPCVQIFDRTNDQINYQCEAFRGLERGLVFRFELERHYDYEMVFNHIEENMGENLLCIFDNGYGDPTEVSENNISQLVDRLIHISEGARFVVSGSSFPNEFSKYDDFSKSKLIGTRLLFSNLSAKYGNYNMFYGDWASTKPRRYDGGGSRPLPRIDFPTKARWIIARSKEEEWDFAEAAKRITRLPEWAERPMVWGTGMIEKTAQGLPGGISTGPEAIACRVNIHLYLQNNYSSIEPPPPPQGKWIDPI